jgi:hypothetical protein
MFRGALGFEPAKQLLARPKPESVGERVLTAGLSAWVAGATIVLVLASPLMFRRSQPAIMTRDIAPSCAPGETSVLVRSIRTTQTTHIISDHVEQSVVPYVRESAFHRHMVVNAPDILRDIGPIPGGSAVVEVDLPATGRAGTNIYLVIFPGSDPVFPPDRVSEICMQNIPGRFNQSLYVGRGLRVIER